MHILVLPSFYPSAARPLIGIFFKEQAEALGRGGHQVGVMVAPRIRETLHYLQHNGKLPDLQTGELETDTALPVYRMHWGWFPRMFPRFCAWLTTPPALRLFERYCAEQGKPDIIHAHNVFYSGYMASRIRQKYGVPVVLTEHATNFLRGRIFLPGQHQVVRQTLQQTDADFAVSPLLAQKLESYGVKKVGYVGNVIDTEFFSPAAAPLDSSPFRFVVVAIKLIGRKGIDLLIKAFAAAFKGQDVLLTIVGEGGEQEKLEALVHHLQLERQITFVGRKPRQGVRDLLRDSHVMVSASSVETFGVTLIEAMACGKPVISTRSGGPDYFVTPETGLLVPPGDVAALSDAMREMRLNYSRYHPEVIRAYCVSNYGEAAIVKRLEGIYTQAIEQFSASSSPT